MTGEKVIAKVEKRKKDYIRKEKKKRKGKKRM